jgi:N-acetyl sugar amidotransferase
MRDVFDVDHIVFGPSVQLLKKINRLGFRKMGDMNWHNHCGIFTHPIQIAVKFKVPLIIWGEHGYTDLGGMHSMDDFVEMTARYRLEHACRGFDWHDMIDKEEGITEKDLLWAKYPTDDELADLGIRGIYLSNYVNWDGHKNYVLSRDLYGWQEHPEAFERTYRRFSNMDDMHENGIHDYLKYVKVGYGRATDHACKDIRWGRMTREEGIEMVRKYDHVKPRKDLERWLKYVDMSEKEFDAICDTFRDRRVWQKQNGTWVKNNIWDESIQFSTTMRPPK